jgi:hypothetical protein
MRKLINDIKAATHFGLTKARGKFRELRNAEWQRVFTATVRTREQRRWFTEALNEYRDLHGDARVRVWAIGSHAEVWIAYPGPIDTGTDEEGWRVTTPATEDGNHGGKPTTPTVEDSNVRTVGWFRNYDAARTCHENAAARWGKSYAFIEQGEDDTSPYFVVRVAEQ